MKKTRRPKKKASGVSSRKAGAKKASGSLDRGFRKVRTGGARPPRWQLHKRRADWFAARAAWPLREAPTERLVKERARAKQSMPAVAGTHWEAVGPSNIGGRMTSVVCHPGNADVLWAGAAGGGVWHSQDAGKTWTSQWHSQDSLNVGSLAIDPKAPAVLYCGTGEANLSADSYAGVGLYRTRDGGATWSLLAASAQTGVPTRIGALAVDPFDSRHILLGGVSHQTGDAKSSLGGMYSSQDGGATWKRETFVSSQGYWCHSIVFDPQNAKTIFATFTEPGLKNGIWRSTDGGASWTHLTTGLPSPDKMERTILAIAPSNTRVIYAQVASGTDHVLGVFRSADGGSTWTEIGKKHFADEGQMNYGNSIVVHPTNPDRVLCGGVDLHLTTDGGKSWKRVTRWDAQRGTKGYAHADHHRLVMPATHPGRVYDMNDGGMDVSEDGGQTWTNRSNGLAATMFYDIDVAQSDPRFYGGGAQDNGTVVTTSDQAGAFFEISGGDGGWMVIDPQNAGHLYASVYNVQIRRFRDSKWTDVSPPDPDADKLWMVYIDMAPNNAKTVFIGTRRVWRSLNDGDAWKDVSGVLDGSPITAVDVGRADPRHILIGTENGGIFRSVDGGNTWSGNVAGAELPGFQITRIESHATNPKIAYVVVGNFGRRHVFRTADGGGSWTCLDENKLPGVPFHAIVAPSWAPGCLVVAGDAGVFVSRDEGGSWSNLTGDLPNVSCVDLVCHEAQRTLTVATYGRSCWRLKFP